MKKYIVTAKEIHASNYEVIAETAKEAKEKVLKGQCEPSVRLSDFEPTFIQVDDLWQDVKGMDKLLEWNVSPFAPITLHGAS